MICTSVCKEMHVEYRSETSVMHIRMLSSQLGLVWRTELSVVVLARLNYHWLNDDANVTAGLSGRFDDESKCT